jgi:uncharacterized peroxidase-related enzyme
MMAFITQISEAQATSELIPLYDHIKKDYGFVPNYFQALGIRPAVIQGHLLLGEAVMRDGALSRALKEEIGLVVSGINSSTYCIAAHMQVLNNLGVGPELGPILATDYSQAPVSEKEMAIFRFAEKLTRKPDEIEKEDAEAVLRAGWDEAALLEAAVAVSWFSLINRISLGLGLVLDF